jgi:hypothetical protein
MNDEEISSHSSVPRRVASMMMWIEASPMLSG